MSEIQWKRLRCDNSGPNCTEIARDGDQVLIRSSNRPGNVAVLDLAEFETLRQAILSGEV